MMSQQEFEPRGQQANDEIYQPHYPYNWSGQHKEGMPRDEPPGTYGSASEQAGYQNASAGPAQVPWWARPQPQQHKPLTFVALLALVIFIFVLTGGLGIAGAVLGSLAHLLGALLAAILGLLIIVCLLIFLIIALVLRTVSGLLGIDRHTQRRQLRTQRRSWRTARRAVRRNR